MHANFDWFPGTVISATLRRMHTARNVCLSCLPLRLDGSGQTANVCHLLVLIAVYSWEAVCYRLSVCGRGDPLPSKILCLR